MITKSDLLPYVPFSVEAAVADARLIQPNLQAVTVCSRSGDGISEWCRLLENAREQMLATRDA